jgi:outer membrane protein
MMKKLLVILNLIFGWSYAQAQAQESPKAMSLQECVSVALENNLRVKRGMYNLRGAQINLNQWKAAMLPSINASSNYNKNYGGGVNPITQQFTSTNFDNMGINANASLLLFNGLRVQNSIRQTSIEYKATNEDLNKVKNDVILSVVSSYTSVVFNKELYANAEFQLKSSQEQLERIKKQVQAGALAKGNELNQEAQVATNEVNLINQENALNISLLQLKQAMQVPGSTNIDIVVPQLQVEDLILDQTPEQIYGISVQSMPEIRSANLRVESSIYALKAAKGNYYPSLSLGGSVSSSYTNTDKLFNVLDPQFIQVGTPYETTTGVPILQNVPNLTAVNYSLGDQLQDKIFKGVGLNLRIPIFNNLQVSSNVQRAAIAKETADIAKKETENTLRQSIETAYNDALAASKTYTASLKQVSAREEAYRMTKQRFEIGAANYVEFRISENDLFQSKSDLARAKYNFIFRKKLLDFYQGKPIDL